MRKQLVAIVRWIAFSIFMLLGLLGTVLPIMPQLIFFLAAAMVILPASPTCRRKYIEWRRRHPRLFQGIERFRIRRRAKRQEHHLIMALLFLCLVIVLPGLASAKDEPPPLQGSFVSYGIAPGESRLIFKAYRDGWFSSLGHDHELLARELAGAVLYRAEKPEASSVTITVSTRGIEVLDPEASAGDRVKISTTLRGEEVLDVARYPEIRFVSTEVAPRERLRDGGLKLDVAGDLSLHGQTRRIRFVVALEPPKEGQPLRATGTIPLNQSDFGIKPYGVGLGAVKVKDRVELEFAVVARP